MQLVIGAESDWDDIMNYLARWLLRHLDDPRLVIWVADRGGQLHPRWIRLIERELDRFIWLERDNKTAELDEIRRHAPNAVPGPQMRLLWRLVIGKWLKSPWHDADLYAWKRRFKCEGITATLRLHLREILSPKVSLREPFPWSHESENNSEPVQLRTLVDWQLVLAADEPRAALAEQVDPIWQAALPLLLGDFERLLCDALDIQCELGGADEWRDRSSRDLPSVSRHWQNRRAIDWTILITLLRDAWLAVHDADEVRAARIAAVWFELPYPAFKRLALFAASQNVRIVPNQWVLWLLADNAWWLWTVDTRREVLRLLVLKGQQLTPSAQRRLEAAILAGPPRKMYRDDLDADAWRAHLAHSSWLYLIKLQSSGLALGPESTTRVEELSRANPDWQLAPEERDEFSHWVSGTGDPGHEASGQSNIAPRKRHDLVRWLRLSPPDQDWLFEHEDTWCDVCRKHLLNSLYALCDLASEDEWPVKRWRQALQVWSEDRVVARSWRYAAPLVQSMPDAQLRQLDNTLGFWLKSASRSISPHKPILLNLCDRVLNLPPAEGVDAATDDEAIEHSIGVAINHPVGHATDALLNLWYTQELIDGGRLPADIETRFTVLCDVRIDRFRHGRVVLASCLTTLFRVDRRWTEQHLLPLFDWTAQPREAKGAWEGFLWSPRLYLPLLTAFKSQFLDTASHCDELGESSQQFTTFLTYAALRSIDGYSADDFRPAFAALPQEALENSAQALAQALESAAGRHEEYWQKRIRPFWKEVWPKSIEHKSAKLTRLLARLCIAAGAEFPSARATVHGFLSPLDSLFHVSHGLRKSGLCSQFPVDTLKLLVALFNEQGSGDTELGGCLDCIAGADPTLANDHDYRRLRKYARKHEM